MASTSTLELVFPVEKQAATIDGCRRFDRGCESENKLQGELDLAVGAVTDLIGIGVGNGLTDAAKVWIGQAVRRRIACRRKYCCADSTIGTGEVGMIQDVEDIRAELHLQSLGNRKILHPGKIPLEERRAAKGIASHITKIRSPASVVSRRNRERIDVVVPIWPICVTDRR